MYPVMSIEMYLLNNISVIGKLGKKCILIALVHVEPFCFEYKVCVVSKFALGQWSFPETLQN